MAVEIYKPKTFLQFYDSMKRYLIGESSTLNNFNIGSRLATLLEAFALILSQTSGDFYQGLKLAIPTSVYNAFDFSKQAGVQSSGTMEFSRVIAAPATYPIALGTAIMLDGIKYETIAAGEITIGNTDSGNIASQCSQIGTDGNVGSGAIDTLTGLGSFISQPDGIESCTNNVAFAGGTEEESDEVRIARFRNFVASLARSPVMGLKAAGLSVTGIVSASVVEHSPLAGWCTLYVDDGTGTLSAPLKTEVEKVVNGDLADSTNYYGYRAAGIQVRVLAPVLLSESITVRIKILDTSLSDPTALKALAQTALETYVNTLRLGWDIIRTEISYVIKESHIDIYDVDVQVPAANVPVASNEVARTNIVTVHHDIVSI